MLKVCIVLGESKKNQSIVDYIVGAQLKRIISLNRIN